MPFQIQGRMQNFTERRFIWGNLFRVHDYFPISWPKSLCKFPVNTGIAAQKGGPSYPNVPPLDLPLKYVEIKFTILGLILPNILSNKLDVGICLTDMTIALGLIYIIIRLILMLGNCKIPRM